MFTLIRPVSAVLLAVFAYFAAVAYGPVYDPEVDLGTTYIWYAVGVSFVVGWVFLGGMLGSERSSSVATDANIPRSWRRCWGSLKSCWTGWAARWLPIT